MINVKRQDFSCLFYIYIEFKCAKWYNQKGQIAFTITKHFQ